MSETIVGIDLGTTNSEIGLLKEGKLQLFKDVGGRTIIPSVVCFSESGKLLVGDEAKNLSLLFPEYSVNSVKRLMGSNESLSIMGNTYTPQEISAMILKELKRIAEHSLGYKIDKVVITVPAYFDDNQRRATKEAGAIAGLEIIRLINEPTAAALSYEGSTIDSKTFLVYDLGGGTFDVSIVDIKNSVIEVLASTGDNRLGGDDFDQRLEIFILNKIKEKYDITIEDRKALSRIKKRTEDVKIELSDEPYVQIKEEYIYEKKGNPIHVDFEISRTEYEELITPLIDQTINSVHQALEEANKGINDIDEILLVGGSTRTPIVRARLKELFKKQPRVDLHPDLCVAMGAAIQAGIIAGEEQMRTLIDITPHAFGTTVMNPYTFEKEYNILIEKNSPLPISKSEAYYPFFPGQKRTIFPVYQGENEDFKQNVYLGECKLDFMRLTGDQEVVCNFNLDLNGILTVTGLEKATGKKEKIIIENTLSHDTKQLLDAKEKLNTMPEYGDGFSPEDAPLKLIQEIESKLDGFSTEDRASAKELILELKSSIESKNQEEVESLTEALSDLKFYLESNV